MGLDVAKRAESAREDILNVDRLWNVKEVAEFLGLSVGTVYHLVSQRRMPCVRLSARCVKFQPAQIETWLQGKTIKETSK